MIFVTVGTHEQSFDRLIRYMDEWAKRNNERVIIQTGFSDYKPENCTWKKMFTYDEMVQNINDARIVITHGGPSSFVPVLQIHKVPIVVPRRFERNEHVNNHQVQFCEWFRKRKGGIIIIDNIDELEDAIKNYDVLSEKLKYGIKNHNQEFCEELEKLIASIMTESAISPAAENDTKALR